MNTLTATWKKYVDSPMKAFVAKAVLLYIAWSIIYYGWLRPAGWLDEWLTYWVGYFTNIGMHWLGYNTTVGLNESSRAILELQGSPLLSIAHECNGLELYTLFAGFIIAYPGPWKHKLWFVPLGVFAIAIINVVRSIVLSVNYIHSASTFEFNHKYTYTIIVYGIVFLFWWGWTKFSKSIED